MKRNDEMQYFILKSDVSTDSRLYEAGTIWVEKEKISHILVLASKYEGENVGLEVQLLLENLHCISYIETHLLIAVPPPLKNRLTVAKDPSWLKHGISIGVNSIVHIYDYPDLPNGAEGIVRFKGRLTGKNGISFGVELTSEHHGKGTTNGTYRRKPYFTCPEDCGVFVSIYRIRLPNEDLNFKPEADGSAKYGDDGDISTVKINERVVWLSDQGPEFATVKWLDVLPDSVDNKTIVGVEFDNPVGSGTGKYKGEQLFVAKRRHASLLPMLGLMRASVYMSMLNEKEHSSSKQDYAIDKNCTNSAHISYTDHVQEKPLNNENLIDDSLKEKKRSIDENILSNQYSQQKVLSQNSNYKNVTSNEHGKDFTDSPLNTMSKSFLQITDDNSKFEGFKIGDRVIVSLGAHWSGKIQWLGTIAKSKTPERVIAGVELDIAGPSLCTDGTFMGKRYFYCKPQTGLFVPLSKCSPRQS